MKSPTIAEAIKDREARTQAKRDRAKELRTNADALDAEADEDERETDVLRRIAESYATEPETTTVSDDGGLAERARWRRYTGKEAIGVMMRETGVGHGPTALMRLLHDAGRNDPIKSVKNNLNDMKRDGLVDNGDRAEWALTAKGDEWIETVLTRGAP